MKKALIACLAVVAMFALANAASAVTCTNDQHPAATLLVPYFQVSVGQWICLADLDGDGRLDIVLSRTVSSSAPNEKGGFDVYLNKVK